MATIKVVVIGPESTGKSTLTKELAAHFDAPFVPEFARTYLESTADMAYTLTDLEAIAKGQLNSIQQALLKKPALLFCDTDLITLHIWSLDKFDQAMPFVEEHMKAQPADLYLLCKPDLAWEPDPLREDATRRDELFEWNAWVLKSINARFVEIHGTGIERTQRAINAVQKFLKTATP